MATLLHTFGASVWREMGFERGERPAAESGRPEASTPPRDPITLPVMRRLNRFWMVVVIAMLVLGIGTSGHQQTLWQSWRGPLMVTLSIAVLLWYMALAHLRTRYGFPLPRRAAYGFIAVGFVLSAALLGLDVNFQGVVYALMGMIIATLPLRQTYLPVAAAVAMYLWAMGLLPFEPGYAPPSFSPWGLFAIAMGVGTVYAIGALVRQRHQLEHTVRELMEAHRRLRLSAARDADVATLHERNRLAREMHDSLGHALVSISIKLEAAQRLYAVDVARAGAEMEETKALVRATMTELRHSLAGLRPAALEEQPLTGALAEMMCEMGRRGGVEATSSVDEQAALLDREVQETLYRIGQEALTNVAKHAHARHVALTLTVDDGLALLEIGDDGVGLGASARNGGGHYGIMGMRERVEALGGTLTLGPRPGGGTVLRTRIPVRGAP